MTWDFKTPLFALVLCKSTLDEMVITQLSHTNPECVVCLWLRGLTLQRRSEPSLPIQPPFVPGLASYSQIRRRGPWTCVPDELPGGLRCCNKYAAHCSSPGQPLNHLWRRGRAHCLSAIVRRWTVCDSAVFWTLSSKWVGQAMPLLLRQYSAQTHVRVMH